VVKFLGAFPAFLTEAGSDATSQQTSALSLWRFHYVLNVLKNWITNCFRLQVYFVIAANRMQVKGNKGILVIIVEGKEKDFIVGRKERQAGFGD